MIRLKGSVTQIRAQSATDMRRRDGEVQRLKKHLEGRRGKDGTSHQVGVVVVTPGAGKVSLGNKIGAADADLDSPEYSLKQETTEFLTQLSQSLSDENDALIGLARATLTTLRSLQGLSADEQRGPETGGSFDRAVDERGVVTGPPSYETLAARTDEVLEHLRELLTNPSFVPLEEVEIREVEIQRLREGWEMMALRWKEAVALMGGWKKRMVDEGDTINLDDLKVGLKLGSDIPSVQEARQSPLRNGEAGRSSSGSGRIQEIRDGVDETQPLSDVEGSIIDDKVDNSVLTTDRALAERSANEKRVPSSRKLSISTIPEENTKALDAVMDTVSLLDCSMYQALQHTPPNTKSRIPLQVNRPPYREPIETF